MAMKISEIIKEAERQSLDITWIVKSKDNPEYDKKRKIANSRFDYRPAAIAQCHSAGSVARLFKIFQGNAPKIRVRSGGHQHEGMCSADDVLLIDLSNLNKIGLDPKTGAEQKIDPSLKEIWIQPGVHLGDVYKTLEKYWMTLPAGGCNHVCVGGLVQGGGWGPSVRNFGLTCDSLSEVEIVLASGEKVFASEGKNADLIDLTDLFWAIRGGGGGNFGVVTNFKLKLYPLADVMTTFTLRWTKEYRRAIVRTWMHRQAEMCEKLTTYGRISVIDEDAAGAAAVLVGGQFYGPKEKLRGHLQPFYAVADPIEEKDQYKEFKKPKSAAYSAGHDETSLISALTDLIGDLQPGAPVSLSQGDSAPPRRTCGSKEGAFEPHPHKVSSAFPVAKENYDQLAEDLIATVENTPFDNEVNRYVSLHGFGGKVKKTASNATAFPYRDKDFILQFQAWWSDPKNAKSAEYVRWIEDFRKRLRGVEGAFINFPDRSLVSDADKERVRLLEHYYGGNLSELRRFKSVVDPDDVFSFGMSIPARKS